MNTTYNRKCTFYFKLPKHSLPITTFLLQTYPWITSVVEKDGEFLATVDERTSPIKEDAFCYQCFPEVPVKNVPNAYDTILINLMRLVHPEHDTNINNVMRNSTFLKEREFEFTSTTLTIKERTSSQKEKELAIDGSVQNEEELVNECKTWKRQYKELSTKLKKQRSFSEQETQHWKSKCAELDALTNKVEELVKECREWEDKHNKILLETSKKEQYWEDVRKEGAMQMMQMQKDYQEKKKVYKSVKKMFKKNDINMEELRQAWSLFIAVPGETHASVKKALAFYHQNQSVLNETNNTEAQLKDLKQQMNQIRQDNKREWKILKQLKTLCNDDIVNVQQLKDCVYKIAITRMTEHKFDCLVMEHLFEPFITKFRSNEWCSKKHVTVVNNSKFNPKQLNAYVRAVARHEWLAPATKTSSSCDLTENEKLRNHVNQLAYYASLHFTMKQWLNRVNWDLGTFKEALGKEVTLTDADRVQVHIINTISTNQSLVLSPPKNMRVWQFLYWAESLMSVRTSFLVNVDGDLIPGNDTMGNHPLVYMYW